MAAAGTFGPNTDTKFDKWHGSPYSLASWVHVGDQEHNRLVLVNWSVIACARAPVRVAATSPLQ